ncbi:MAG: GTPase HflX [Candidatus Mycalebacterium zealandia]|nr:MAG: GTPase HflX [Candidatus Mycalebacterium zealandia]
MTPEFSSALCRASEAVKRNVAVLLNKKGRVAAVFEGNCGDFELASFFRRYRDTGRGVRNFRLILTHADGRGLTDNEKFTLINERLEIVGVVQMRGDGADKFEFAYPLVPATERNDSEKWKIVEFSDCSNVNFDIESALEPVKNRRFVPLNPRRKNIEHIFLIAMGRSQKEAETSLQELETLAVSAGKKILGSRVHILKRSKKSVGNTVLGEKKLTDFLLLAKHEAAGAVIFDTELAPSEISEIQSRTDMRIVDRTQLILEIFSLRASSKEGKLQVKLAELKYALPRLSGSGIQMSQPGAGIGTRGPGEKALEKERRQLRKRIRDLEKQMEAISGRRERTRANRMRGNTEIVSLAGYTNAGKSTLFSALTKEDTEIADKMFSTLGTKTRRMYSPRNSTILLTDTVGFIKDLPKDLAMAFRATLEELGKADLLLHVADAGDLDVENKIESVESILDSMGFGEVPRLLVFNKTDIAPLQKLRDLSVIYPKAIFVSAAARDNLGEIAARADKILKDRKQNYSLAI